MARIMIIDDDPGVRHTFQVALERVGHTVSAVENGAVALRELTALEVDLVITDIIMPEKEGIETIQEVRERFPQIRILAVSGGGHTAGDWLEDARLLGADATLAKPVSPTTLCTTVAALLTL